MYSLEGQHVLVVGGSSGLGLATAVHAHRLGAKVTIASRSAEKLAAAQKAVGERCTPVEADVSDESSMARLFDGAGALDHIFFSAGRYPKALVREAEVSKVRIGLQIRRAEVAQGWLDHFRHRRRGVQAGRAGRKRRRCRRRCGGCVHAIDGEGARADTRQFAIAGTLRHVIGAGRLWRSLGSGSEDVGRARARRAGRHGRRHRACGDVPDDQHLCDRHHAAR